MSPTVMERAVLIDSAVVIYALAPDDPRSAPCRSLLTEVMVGRGRGYASVEMIQEVVHHRMRRTADRRLAIADGRDLMTGLMVLDFDREVLDLSLDLIARVPTIRGRDAVHAATALAYGIDTIASPDHAFDGIPGLRRLDPLAAP
ncbi:type II toxin-antitoxin system VapC family toxin [Agromyces laixinhei]|uniref:type II toxin-antitoxin system VapC family toxin n=1 Tax=Agromyces laixinhei TaxID=2585717 RepID=UPI0012EDAD56|nr:type II toxin-antitoxin system VapC family toxin [Agromyces laixinhei]